MEPAPPAVILLGREHKRTEIEGRRPTTDDDDAFAGRLLGAMPRA